MKEVVLKKDIHPEYKETTITCACGNVIHTRSTKSNIRVEICSRCHPFFTGKQKLVDTAGRVERFRKKYGLDDSKEEKSSDQDPSVQKKEEENQSYTKAKDQ